MIDYNAIRKCFADGYAKIVEIEALPTNFHHTMKHNRERQVNDSMQLQAETGDWLCNIYAKNWTNLSNDEIDRIVAKIPDEYREHLIGFHPTFTNYFGKAYSEDFCSWWPIFKEHFMQIFIDKRDKYMTEKQAWCNRYGCD